MLEITYKSKHRLSSREHLLFNKIYNIVLGKKYGLSLVICTDKESKHNTLAYPLTKSEGEIFLNPSRKGDYSLPYLFLHSSLHLKGYDHGPKMDNLESKLATSLKLIRHQ